MKKAFLLAFFSLILLSSFVLSTDFIPSSAVISAPFNAVAMTINTNEIKLEVRNYGAEQVILKEFNATIKSPNATSCSSNFSPAILEPGESTILILNRCSGLIEEAVFDADISITYIRTGSALEQVSTGAIRGKIQFSGRAPINSTQLCKDSDGGKNFFVKGIAFDNKDYIKGGIDSCATNENEKLVLFERYCSEDQVKTLQYECPAGCSDGACMQKACTSPACNGAYKTGEYEDGCPIYRCPAQEDDMNVCLNNPTNWYDQQTNKCFSGFSSDIIAKKCYDPDGGINKYEIAHTFGFRSVFADSKDQRIRTGGKDACIYSTTSTESGSSVSSTSTIQSSNSDRDIIAPNPQLVEHYCDDSGFIQTTYLDCPNGCNEGKCIKGEDIKETITCYFENSKIEQKCYISKEFNDDDLGEKVCKGIESCTMEFESGRGEKIAWKSSCGGYQSTFQDGQDEKVVFDCNVGETNTTEIFNNAFRNAYWKCYDKRESFEGGESSCKPYGLWKKYASEFCNAKCSSGKEKCGVSSFSLSNPCYSDIKPQVTESTPISSTSCEEYAKECKTGNQKLCDKWASNCMATTDANATIDALICKDSCPSDGKCYPFGYRKSSQFCSDSGAFTSQSKGDEKCENNFECSSNVCVSGQCVSEGTIKKILNWFKNIFN